MSAKDRAAWRLLTEYTQSASLLKHALSVEICVRAYGEQRAAELGLPPDEGPRPGRDLCGNRSSA